MLPASSSALVVELWRPSADEIEHPQSPDVRPGPVYGWVDHYAVLTHDDSQRAYIAVTAINVGEVPTTITHMSIQRFPSLWAYLRSKPSWMALVPEPHLDDMPPVLPKLLNTGEQWPGLADRSEDLLEMNKQERLYIGVEHSFAKRPVLARLHFKPDPFQNAELRD